MAPKADDFKPGLKPLEFKVIVWPFPVDEMAGGGIIAKPEQTKAKDRMEQTKAILVDYTDMAFSKWRCALPKRGDTVVFSKLAGDFYTGDDGKEYKLLNDEDLIGYVEEA